MSKHKYSGTQTLFFRVPPDYRNLGTYESPTEKGYEMYDHLIAQQLHPVLDWCGDEILCPVDFPATDADEKWVDSFDWKAITNRAFEQLCSMDDDDLWGQD